RTALEKGRIAADAMPAALRMMVAGGDERDATQLLPVLLANVDAIRSLLAAAGHDAAARSLLTAADLRRLDIYNPHLRELLAAVQEQGHLIVIHNDFALARILEDFRYAAARPLRHAAAVAAQAVPGREGDLGPHGDGQVHRPDAGVHPAVGPHPVRPGPAARLDRHLLERGGPPPQGDEGDHRRVHRPGAPARGPVHLRHGRG